MERFDVSYRKSGVRKLLHQMGLTTLQQVEDLQPGPPAGSALTAEVGTQLREALANVWDLLLVTKAHPSVNHGPIQKRNNITTYDTSTDTSVRRSFVTFES